jgi:hypothetical protein
MWCGVHRRGEPHPVLRVRQRGMAASRPGAHGRFCCAQAGPGRGAGDRRRGWRCGRAGRGGGRPAIPLPRLRLPRPHWGQPLPRGPHATTRVPDRSPHGVRRLHLAVGGHDLGDHLRTGHVDGHHVTRHVGAGHHGRPGTSDRRRHRRRLAVRAAASRDQCQGRLHVGDGPGDQPADLPLPRVRRHVPRRLQPPAPERVSRPGDHPQARGGRRHQPHQGHRLLRGQAAGRSLVRLRELQPPPRPSLQAGKDTVTPHSWRGCAADMPSGTHLLWCSRLHGTDPLRSHPGKRTNGLCRREGGGPSGLFAEADEPGATRVRPDPAALRAQYPRALDLLAKGRRHREAGW